MSSAGKDLERIIEKIRKLQALAGSANVHEAALAATRVQEILFRYELDLDQVESSAESEYEGQHVFLDARAVWKGRLFSVVAEAHFCRAFGVVGVPRKVFIVGEDPDIQVAVAQYEFLRSEIERLGTFEHRAYKDETPDWKQVHPRTWRNSFFHGAVETIGARLLERRDRFREMSASSMALVVRKQSDLESAVRRLVGAASTRQAGTNGDWGAYVAGSRAAERIGIDPMIQQARYLLEN